jgi:hypothetical protein
MDREAPAAPVVERAVMYPDGVSLGATFSTDTVAVQILYKSTTGEDVELWTTPGRSYVCGPQAPAAGEISITAVDDAGNTSTTLGTVYPIEYHGHRHHGCGMWVVGLLFIGIPAVLIALGIVLLFRRGYRRYKLERPGDEVSPLVAEAMARATLDAKLLTLAIGLVLAMLLYFTDDAFYAFLVAYVPASRILHVVRVRRFLAMLDSLELPATLHDNLLAVHGGYIVVPRSIAREAKRRRVPAAIRR